MCVCESDIIALGEHTEVKKQVEKQRESETKGTFKKRKRDMAKGVQ